MILYNQSFSYFAQSPSHEILKKHAKKVPQNLEEILSNSRLYNIFETYLSCWGSLPAVKLQIYLESSSLKLANNVPRLPGVDYVVKNWALAMMLKALPLVHFWSVLSLKEQMMTSLRKMLKTLVSSVQTALKITTKSAVFLRLLFGEVCLENSHNIAVKSANFSLNLSLKFP